MAEDSTPLKSFFLFIVSSVGFLVFTLVINDHTSVGIFGEKKTKKASCDSSVFLLGHEVSLSNSTLTSIFF